MSYLAQKYGEKKLKPYYYKLGAGWVKIESQGLFAFGWGYSNMYLKQQVDMWIRAAERGGGMGKDCWALKVDQSVCNQNVPWRDIVTRWFLIKSSSYRYSLRSVQQGLGTWLLEYSKVN